MSPRRPPTTALIGAGRLARAFLPGLVAAGYPVVSVVARRVAAARRAASLARGAHASTDLAAAAQAGLILLAVPDPEIAPLADSLANLDVPTWNGRVVLHHAGALGPGLLRPLRARGAAVGVLHPLQCIGSSAAAAELLAGSRARIEGTPPARVEARRLAAALGMVPLSLPDELSDSQRRLYHATASMLSNDLLALLGLGIELLESIGLGRRAAAEGLAALARGTLTQAQQEGPAAALSGPVVRGDAATLEAHLRALRRRSRSAAELHRLLSRRLLRLAETENVRLAPAARRRIASVLRDPNGGRRIGAKV